MLAVTRLEKWRVLKARNNVVKLFEGLRTSAQESTFCAHTLQHRGGNIVKNLDYQNLCLTKTCCNCSARLCPLKIPYTTSKPHLETTKLQGP